MVRNASSTFVQSNADVSINEKLCFSAYAFPSSISTARKCFKSHLFPTSNTITFGTAYCFNSFNHLSKFSKEDRFEIS